MIKVTSDAANKLIKKLEQEKGILTDKISKMSTFIVAITENYDQIKAEQEAEFNLNETISQIDEIDKKIITIFRKLFDVYLVDTYILFVLLFSKSTIKDQI